MKKYALGATLFISTFFIGSLSASVINGLFDNNPLMPELGQHVSKEVSKKLVDDIKLFRGLKIDESKSQKLLDKFSLRNWRTEDLLNWLVYRIRYVVSPYDLQVQSSNGEMLSSDFTFASDSKTIFTYLLPKTIEQALQAPTEEPLVLQIQLENGSRSFQIESLERSGILILNEDKLYQLKNSKQYYLHESLYRLGNLFHEARHADKGNLKHVQCPAEHPHEGQYACDSGYFGAYHIEAMILKDMLMSAKDLVRWDVIRMKTRILDAYSRILPYYFATRKQHMDQNSDNYDQGYP